jgi:hypothetical protein
MDVFMQDLTVRSNMTPCRFDPLPVLDGKFAKRPSSQGSVRFALPDNDSA